MEEKKLPIPKDFFKQFKNREEFHTFFNSLFKEGVEEMLKGELDEHLGYEKHSKEGNNSGNSRNGFSRKKVKTESLGDRESKLIFLKKLQILTFTDRKPVKLDSFTIRVKPV